MLKPLTKTRNQKVNGESSANDISEVVPVSGILCDHGALDPHKAHNMKRMSKVHDYRMNVDGASTLSSRKLTKSLSREMVLIRIPYVVRRKFAKLVSEHVS